MLCYALSANAQTPFNDRDSIDANNISALALVHGDMWWDPQTMTPYCKYPAGTGKSVGFTAALWMSGYDAMGQLHVAAQTYRQDGNDYWPGPLDASGALDYTTSQKWAKIWKVRRSEVNSFLALTTHDLSNTPQSILTWPAKGNTYAAGKAGAALTVTNGMAPFVDLNGDGNYQPLSGEYPAFPGEQALWWVFSDNGPTHSQTNAQPLKVEVQVLAYAFKRNTLIDNVVYYDYTIVNRSPNTYTDFRLALWSDIDLGYYLDDFIGFDSSHRMGVTYNATLSDGQVAGYPAGSYGANPPIAGITMVRLPGDAGASKVPVGSYMYYNNDVSLQGNPTSGMEFSYYMRSQWRSGAHLKNTFAGPGVPNTGYGTGPDCNYVFNSDPTTPGGWDECTSGNNPGDRRYIIATNSFTLNAGGLQKVVMALVVDSAGGGCPSMDLTGIREVADTAWNAYNTIATSVEAPRALPGLVTIYPNPAHGLLTIDHRSYREPVAVSIYNMMGQRVMTAGEQLSQTVMDISTLPKGMYLVRYAGGATSGQETIIKD